MSNSPKCFGLDLQGIHIIQDGSTDGHTCANMSIVTHCYFLNWCEKKQRPRASVDKRTRACYSVNENMGLQSTLCLLIAEKIMKKQRGSTSDKQLGALEERLGIWPGPKKHSSSCQQLPPKITMLPRFSGSPCNGNNGLNAGVQINQS